MLHPKTTKIQFKMDFSIRNGAKNRKSWLFSHDSNSNLIDFCVFSAYILTLAKQIKLLFEMLGNSKRPFGQCSVFGQIQQINILKINSIEQSQTEQSLPIQIMPSHLAIDNNKGRYYRFQPCRKFISRHKIMPHRRSKTKLKCYERINTAKIIRRVVPVPPRGSQDEGKQRQQLLLCVFDWMMEVAALMKISKNAYYRAILILKTAVEAESILASGSRINELACAALAMGSKFECSQRNYLQEVFLVNFRRVSKLEISHAQHSILKALDWNVPVHVNLQQTLSRILQHWQQFLWDCGGKAERAVYIKCFQEGRLLDNIYVEVVYALDFLIVRCHEWLKIDKFTQPVLLSIYIVFSIRAGDSRLDRFTLWPLFLKFIDFFQLMPLDQIGRLKSEILRCFWEFRMMEVLGDIPLGYTLEKLMKKKDEQFYIPKIETIL